MALAAASDSRPLHARQCWVFDLDGTLTVAVHDFGEMRALLGVPPQMDIIEYVTQQPGARGDELRRRLDELEHKYVSLARIAPGAACLLEQLHRQNRRIGLLTRNTREVALLVLARLGLADYFPADSIVDRWSAEPKPHPGGLLKLLEHWQAVGDNAVMVGDYLHDLLCGRAAGALTILVDPQRAFLWPEHADLCVGSLEEILAIVPPFEQV